MIIDKIICRNQQLFKKKTFNIRSNESKGSNGYKLGFSICSEALVR